MLKKFLIILVLMFTFNLSAKIKIQKLIIKDVFKPHTITINDKIMVIADNYTLKLFKKDGDKFNSTPFKTFGKRGEGPQEFKEFPFPQILKDEIMVSSLGKVLFYNFKGNLIKEQKTNIRTPLVKYLDGKFVSNSISRKDKTLFISYNVYSSDFTNNKSFHESEWCIQPGKKRTLFETYFFDTYQDKAIFAYYNDEPKIGIVDKNAKIIRNIILKTNRQVFNSKDMKNIINSLKNNSADTSYLEFIKKTRQPKYFPYIRYCKVDKDKIYVFTYKKKNNLTQCLVYNFKGKEIKRCFVPIKETTLLDKAIFTVYNNTLFQLIEDIDKEEWFLHISKI